MTITIDIDRDKNLSVIKFSGIVPFEELRESLQDYYKSGPTEFIIVDLKNAKGGAKTYSHDRVVQLSSYIENIRQDREKGMTAFVAPKDLYFGICRMLEIYKDGSSKITFRTFHTMDEAVEWIKDTDT